MTYRPNPKYFFGVEFRARGPRRLKNADDRGEVSVHAACYGERIVQVSLSGRAEPGLRFHDGNGTAESAEYSTSEELLVSEAGPYASERFTLPIVRKDEPCSERPKIKISASLVEEGTRADSGVLLYLSCRCR